MFAFLFDFQFLFTNLTRNVSSTALSYLKGLLVCRRRNCQTMAEELQESNRQRLHHFITESKWSYQRVMDFVTLQFWKRLETLGLGDDCCLLIDECGNPKKGRSSAGVKRQYCGQLGKNENCQVGVFAALCAGSLVNLVQARLYNIDKNTSKIDLARTLIDHVVKELRIKVRWVCFDAFYGRDAALLAHLVKRNLFFVADVQDNLKIWLEPFQMRVPSAKPGSRGRKPTQAQANRPSVSIRNYAAGLSPRDWKYVRVRHQDARKKLKAWFHAREVYILDPTTNRRMKLTLLIRQDKDGTIKYSFCHCPGATLQELAYRSSKRYFVEKAFREGKKELGLNEYQTRSSQSWHKHMAMIMIAQLFVNDEKMQLYVYERLWVTTQDVLQALKSTMHFIKRTIENLMDYIMGKQPPDKRLVKKYIYLRI